jgi:acyl carrier protein
LLQPVPIGVAGELYIGGSGVARGYLRRPELTEEKFLPDPFRPGGRLYRTGDLARYRNDGEIEYLGRRDGQVKIRGFRIETGEIESQIRRFPGVREAVVMARSDGPGNLRLVAYVVPETVPIPELRRALKRQLAGPMIPAAFVSLEALPLTPNGKVDRLALPAPGSARPKLAESYAPPRDEVESALATIWVGLLGVEAVGVHDDFFDLGGHSLLATQLISRIRDQFSVELPLRLLFQFPTVAELAEAVSQAPAAAPSAPIARLGRPSRVGASDTKQS